MKRKHVPKSKRIHGERVECYGRHWHKSQYLSSSYSTSKKKKAKNKISRVPVNSCQWLHQIQCTSIHTTTTLQEYTSLALKKYVPDIAVVMYAIFETYFTHFSKQYKQHPTILKAHFTNLLPSCHAVGICRKLLRKGWKEGQWLPGERKKKQVKQQKTLPENIPIIPIAFYQTFQSFPMTNYKTVQIQREHTAIHFSVLPLVCWDTYSKAARANWTHAMMNEPNMAAVKKKKRSVSTTPKQWSQLAGMKGSMEHQWTTTMVLPVPRWYRTVRQQLFSTGSTTNNRNNVLVLAMGTIVHVAMLV